VVLLMRMTEGISCRQEDMPFIRNRDFQERMIHMKTGFKAKRILTTALLGVVMALGADGVGAAAQAATDTIVTNSANTEAATLKLTQKWDKVFPQSDKVQHRKVTFHNRYGITLAADLYEPKNVTGKLAAIAVSGPFGAVKEQSSGLYAQAMAERGYLTIAFDPSFTGESGGAPRDVASPEINTEDFSAAVDFLSTQDNVDPNVLASSVLWLGRMALNTAAMDTRVKATVTSTMYDMTRVMANGYFDAMRPDERYLQRQKLNEQRTQDYKAGTYAKMGGLPDRLPTDAPVFVKNYYDYYKTNRGYHVRSVNSNAGWNTTSAISFMTMPLLAYSDEDPQCGIDDSWRECSFCLFQQRCVQKAERR